MDLDINRIAGKIQQNDFIKKFIKELNMTLEKLNNQKELEGDKMEDIRLTQEEDLKLYRKKYNFLQEFFKDKLVDLSKGEIFIVTDKFENDAEFHRYKVAQYINNHERKYVAFEKDLPENVKLGDIVRKVDEKYIYDEDATKYVNDTINKFKQEIINGRNPSH